MVKNGLAVGNTTSTKHVINSAGQWIGDPTGVIQNSYDQANSAFDQANTVLTLTQSAYDSGNNTLVFAQASFDKANTDGVVAQAAYDYANTLSTSTGSGGFPIVDLGLISEPVYSFVDMGTL